MNKSTISTNEAAIQTDAHPNQEKSTVEGDKLTSPVLSDDRSAAIAYKLDTATQTEERQTEKRQMEERQTEKRQTEEPKRKRGILSDEAKQRAQILLEKLTRDIEHRIKLSNSMYPHMHTDYPGAEHYKDSSRPAQSSSKSSDDPYTDKRPPKSQRRSPEQSKTPTQNELTPANDTWSSRAFFPLPCSWSPLLHLSYFIRILLTQLET